MFWGWAGKFAGGLASVCGVNQRLSLCYGYLWLTIKQILTNLHLNDLNVVDLDSDQGHRDQADLNQSHRDQIDLNLADLDQGHRDRADFDQSHRDQVDLDQGHRDQAVLDQDEAD